MKAFFGVRGVVLALWMSTALSAAAAPAVSVLQSPYSNMLHDTGDGFYSVVSAAGLWVGFAATTVILLLPGAWALTTVRIVLPANAIASLWAAANATPLSPTGHGLAVGCALAAAVVVLLPTFADAVVNADSYGDERRYLLRPPGPVLIAVIVPAWIVIVAGATVGPLLLANQRWAVGAVATSAGIAIATASWLKLHRLARRWLVFVPGGIAMHDHLTLSQPIPVSRRSVASIGPAPAGSDATDLTANAFGIALELRFKTPVAAAVATGRGEFRNREIKTALISPSRPAAVMDTAMKKGITIL